MTVDQFLLLLGGIIVAGFVANLVFRYLKVPSVLLLIGLGILLGPVLEIVPAAPLLQMAPYFGTIALLVILFEGGLDLEIRQVIEEAGSTVLLTVSVFLISYVLVFLVAYFVLHLPLVAALILAGMLGGTSPAIILPVVSGLRVSENVRTMLSIEPAFADALIIVSVLLTIQIYQTQTANVLDISQTILGSFVIAILIATLAGILWARFISTLRGETVSYMLTLGFLFLLYVVLEHSGGNGAVGILAFGIILANVGDLVHQARGKIRRLLGVKIDAAKYALDQFIHNITVEISFLVRTFFFVFLGLLIDFRLFTLDALGIIVGLTALLLLGRYLGAQLLFRLRPGFTTREKWLTIAMVPRGLATAVMAFVPLSMGIPGTEHFVLYALGTIVLTSFIMSVLVAYIEFRYPAEHTVEVAESTEESKTPVAEPPSPTATETIEQESDSIFPSPKSSSEAQHLSLAELLMKWFGISLFRFKELDYIATQALTFWDTLFWFQILATTLTTTLGFMLDLPIVVTIGLFFSPIAPLVNTVSFALTTGDVYLFLKALSKFFVTIAVIFILSLIMSWLLPFIGVPTLMDQLINPTLLDFALALAAGVFLSLVILRGRSTEMLIFAPLLAYLIFLPLITLGFSLGSAEQMAELMQSLTGSSLLFTANLTGVLLGSALTLLLLGVTHHEASEYIAEWKQEELGSKWLRKLFVESKLARWLGATGTVRARLFVLLLFALILLIPLQRTVDEIALRYRITKVLNETAMQMFEQPQRSTVLAVQYEIQNQQIIARVRVATSDFFTQEEIEDFERRTESKLGMPVQLHLVQSPGSIGAVSKSLLTPREETRNFPERLNYLLSDLEAALSAIPSASGIRIVHIGPRFIPATRQTVIDVAYLNRREIEAETAVLIQSLIAQALQLPLYDVALHWIPDYYTSPVPELEQFRNPMRSLSLVDVLRFYPSLHLTLYLPANLSDEERIREQLSQQLLQYRFPEQFTIIRGSTSQYEVMLSLPESPVPLSSIDIGDRQDTTR